MEWLDKIPDGAWAVIKVIVLAVVGLVGWFGKTAFDSWRNSRRPFKQDRDRYEAVMASIEPSDIYYFKDPDYGHVAGERLDSISGAAYAVSNLHRPSYLNKKLTDKEDKLRYALNAFVKILSLKFFPHHNNQNIFTMYWDDFAEWKDEDQKKAREVQTEIKKTHDTLVVAYEDFRDYGNKLFADRLVKEKSDG